MKHVIEISQNMFNTIINHDDKVEDRNQFKTYFDIVYIKHDSKLTSRHQNGIVNYYMQDINA